MSDGADHTRTSSCPDLVRASTTSAAAKQDVDGRGKPGPDRRGGWLRKTLIGVAVTFAVVAVAFTAWVVSLGPLPLDEARRVSTTIVDRNGKLLRAYAMTDGRWRLPVDARRDVDPTYLKLLLAFE